MPETYTPRLKKHYDEVVRNQLMEQFGYKSPMQVPRLDKVVLNMGVGEAVGDSKLINSAAEELAKIAGQKPVITKARKSIATFKIRQGMPIGVATTIRGDRMWDFLDRLLSVVLPRIRDFRGLNPRSFDGSGSYSFGVTEQLVFPEIDYDDIDQTRGMDITIVTTAENDEQGRALLTALGFPFRQQGGSS